MDKKRGRIVHPTNLINGFRESVNESGLIELGMKGHWFTWERSRGTYMFVEERLDRAMDTCAWLNAFRMAEVSNLESVGGMKCVSSVRYTVIHNGHEIGPIIPQRGLRQGDPLSHYLFLICIEGISSLLQAETRRGSIHEECANVKHCLRIYEMASGHTINYAKSSISFSPNLPNEQKHLMCETLGVRYTTDHEDYLGLPSVVGRNKSEIFALLKEKTW
ncbi:uncharacterized protein [Henckelia pumila]|uniref:uncharacterized protein n=1 Tax=Henckelia pumila TaxID=405737 RepID=UPI003C6DC883